MALEKQIFANLEELGLPPGYLPERMKEIGATTIHLLPDGRELAIFKQPYNWRLTIGPAGEPTYEDFWCYLDFDQAFQDCAWWNGEGDPPGEWIRHGGSARRREWREGKIYREWVQR